MLFKREGSVKKYLQMLHKIRDKFDSTTKIKYIQD